MTDQLDTEGFEPSPIPRGISAGNERSELYILCCNHLPNHRKVVSSKRNNIWRGLDIEKISNEIGVSKQKISSWMKNNRVPGQRVGALIKLDGSTLSYEKIGPYISTR